MILQEPARPPAFLWCDPRPLGPQDTPGGVWLQEGRVFKAQGSRVVVGAPTCRPHQGTAPRVWPRVWRAGNSRGHSHQEPELSPSPQG